MRNHVPGHRNNTPPSSAAGHSGSSSSQGVDSPSLPISKQLEANIHALGETLANCGDLIILPWSYGPHMEQKAVSAYFETLVRDQRLNDVKEALQDMTSHEIGPAAGISADDVMRFFSKHGVTSHPVELMETIGQSVAGMLDGKVVIFWDGWDKATGYVALDVAQRQVGEPVNEPVVQGPHNSTIEDLGSNIGMIRGLLKSPGLKFEYRTAGAESRRSFAFGYLDGAVNPETLREFKRRLDQIDQEEIMETSYLEEWLGEARYSPFPQVRYTERTDTAIAALLDGKIIAMVNGTPSILICPGNFLEFFMSSEDYYHRSIFSSLIRLLRLVSFVIALLLPSTYIALSTFHSEMIPTVLLLAILNTREGIPFPAFLEALIMEFFFELLREAGIRLPRPIGSAVSIVGALVIGEAAIQSKIASPVMVIVVALTGIASFSLPQYNMAIAVRILRFPYMVLAATFGGLGIMFGFILTLLHLTTLRSIGQPYLAPAAPLDLKQWRDVFWIVPRKLLLHAPRNRHLHKKTAGRK